jgi:hypothetical protein
MTVGVSTGRPRKAGSFDPLPEWAGIATRLVHGARRPDLNAGAVTAPIYQTSTFHFPAAHSESAEYGKVYLYSRLENPTSEVASEILRGLEGGEEARLFGSGMGAITATVLSLVRSGDEVVALQELYGGTTDLLTELAPRLGIRVRFVPMEQAGEPETFVGRGTRLVWLESPTTRRLSRSARTWWCTARPSTSRGTATSWRVRSSAPARSSGGSTRRGTSVPTRTRSPRSCWRAA